MRNVKNCYKFSKTINKFGKNTNYINEISIESWQLYFINIYSPSPFIQIIHYTNTHPTLDKPITIDELTKALSYLKNNKTTGLDLIPNECYKFLTPPRIHYLLNLFNVMLTDEFSFELV